MPSRGIHIKALVLLGVCLFVDISESSPLGFDNILNTNALTSAYSSYVYAFNPNDWKSVSFNTTDFAAKAFFGNFLFVASALAVLSLLPENAFCSLRGTCRGGSGYAQHAYQRYQNRWRQKYAQNYQQRLDYDEDVEYVDRLGLSEQMPQQSQENNKFVKALRPSNKPYQRSFTRSKRDTPYYSDYDYNYDDSAYVEKDLSSLPAEHRVLPEERQGSRNPLMQAMVELFFGNPVRRVAQGWNQVYQHYEDYWRFRLNNPGQSYRRYLRTQKRRRRPQHYQYAQSRQDTIVKDDHEKPESTLDGLFVQH